MKKFHSVSFYIFLLLFILILPLNILFIDSAKRSSDALLRQAEYSVNSILSIYTKDIDSKIDKTSAFLADIIQNNSSCQTILHQTGDDIYQLNKFILAQQFIDSSFQQNAGDVYFMYSPKLSDILVMKRNEFSPIANAPIAGWVRENIDITHTSDWQLVTIDTRPYLIHSNYTNGMYIGALIRLTPYMEQIEKSIDYPTTGISFYQNAPEETPALLTVAASPEYASAYLCATISRQDILSGLSFFQRYSFSIALFYLLLIPLLFFALGVLLLRPLRTIVHALTQLESGNQDFRISDSRTSFLSREFMAVMVSFNHMANSIHRLTIENYEQQLTRQQVELDNLQLTIRPHFLQNTFGILFTLCQMGENEQLGHFILYLSDYFRYIYQGVHQLAAFPMELSIIKGYLELASVQHPGGFEIAYELPDNLDDVMVPPLLIHNFIENIMSHALVHGRCLHILLRMEWQNNNAVFTITDDGIGMAEQTVLAINEGKTVSDHDRVHVGLSNSYQRLEKIYHGAAGMHLTSAPGAGTSIQIWIPQQTTILHTED